MMMAAEIVTTLCDHSAEDTSGLVSDSGSAQWRKGAVLGKNSNYTLLPVYVTSFSHSI